MGVSFGGGRMIGKYAILIQTITLVRALCTINYQLNYSKLMSMKIRHYDYYYSVRSFKIDFFFPMGRMVRNELQG